MYIALVYIVLRFSMLCYLSFSIHSHPLLSHCLKTDFKTSLNTSNISWFITIMTESTFYLRVLEAIARTPDNSFMQRL